MPLRTAPPPGAVSSLGAAPLARRAFLGHAAAATWLAASSPSAAAPATASPTPSRCIDTHTHFYDPTRPQGVPWPGRGTPLYRTVLPADFRKLAQPLGITGTVVVEASPWVEDNQWLLDLAERDPFVVGVVGNLAPGEAAFAENLRRFARQPLYRGIRISGKLATEQGGERAVLDDFRRMADADLTLDINGGPTMLPALARIAGEIPSLRIVINHLAGVGDTAQGVPETWLEGMRRLADSPQVSCKVSALVEMAKKPADGQAPDQTEHYLPVLDAVWNTLGENRLLFGSNWPVSDRGAPLSVVHGIVARYFAGKGQAAVEKFFWKNSQVAYRWRER